MFFSCRYQILGVFLLIQLCILAAEGLRRSSLSSVSTSAQQAPFGTYQTSAGKTFLHILMLRTFSEYHALNVYLCLSPQNTKCFIVWRKRIVVPIIDLHHMLQGCVCVTEASTPIEERSLISKCSFLWFGRWDHGRTSNYALWSHKIWFSSSRLLFVSLQ